MQRAAAGALFAGAAAAAQWDSSYSSYSFFCWFNCDTNASATQCFAGNCPAQLGECVLGAWQPFFNSTVCEMYKASEPWCNMETRQCEEAADFQRVWDRQIDLNKVYQGRDWHGVAHVFHIANSLSLLPNATDFEGMDAVGQRIEAYYHSTQDPSLELVLQQVITAAGSGPNATTALHAVGLWRSAAGEIPYYTRWTENPYHHWEIEASVFAGNKHESTGGGSDLQEIVARHALFSKLYAAKDFGNLSSLYAPEAVIFPPRGAGKGVLLDRRGVAAWLSGLPFGDALQATPELVKVSPDGMVAHEVGSAGAGNGTSGYYVRWTRAAANASWDIEVLDLLTLEHEGHHAALVV